MLAEQLPKRIRYTRMAQDHGQIRGSIDSPLLDRLTVALADNGLSETLPAPAVFVEMGFENNGVDCVKALGEASFEFQWCCQRCLEAVELRIATTIDVALSHQAKVIERLDFDQDSLLLEGEHVSIAELIEDQLLLALPMSPRHADCVGLGPEDSEPDVDNVTLNGVGSRETEVEEGRQRPFANLKAITQKGD